MQAQIRFNKSVYNTLLYHERKQKLGDAECLAAGNFIKDLHDLSFQDKQYHLQRLASLNEAVTNRVLHISLTFYPTQKLSNKEMVGLADEYLQKMKLDHLPHLIYRHHDTLHPHMHLVMPGVQKDATCVHLTPANYYESANITRELTLQYHLIQSPTAEERRQRQGQALKVRYGEMPLRSSIGNVLNKVLPLYKYPSLEGLNALLRLYNLEAYRGKEGSERYLRRGLVVRVLDEDGKSIRGYFKASHFDGSPTLDRLERQFILNKADEQREQHRQRVTATLAWNMTKKSMDLTTLEKELQRQRINVVWSKEKDNVFFVDHETKAVFDGRELGERYNAAALRSRLVPAQVQEQVLSQHQQHRHSLKIGF